MRRIDIRLTVQGQPSSIRERLIEYISEHPVDVQALVMETLEARFLPFVMKPDSNESKAIALQCVHKLEGYANAIREHHGLVLPRKPLGREVKR